MITIKIFQLQALLLIFLVSVPFSVLAKEAVVIQKCEGPYRGGRTPSRSDLSRVLKSHALWEKSNEKKGERADLCTANLAGAQLQGADLVGAKLRGTNLARAQLQRADLSVAELQGAYLGKAQLQAAVLLGANMEGAILQEANFEDANLMAVTFPKGYVEGSLYKINPWRNANLTKADISGVDLTGVVFDLAPGGIPLVPSFARAKNLDQLAYTDPPHTLVELRNAFKLAGMAEQERILIFILNHGAMEKSWNEGLLGRVKYLLSFVLFEWTCKWGREPTRPLLLLVQLIFPLAVVYTFAATRKNEKGRIWKIWDPDRVERATGDPTERYPLSVGWRQALGVGIYFSLLSAFRIGWRDLNVGAWISRLQPNEYNLRATGWVRVVSGLQSIISVYLLALWVLTTFGRPFE